MDAADWDRLFIPVRASKLRTSPPLILLGRRNRTQQAGILKRISTMNRVLPDGKRSLHGYCTSDAHNPFTLGPFAFLFQFRFSLIAHRPRESHQSPGTPGSRARLS